jgi:hypothetical protein
VLHDRDPLASILSALQADASTEFGAEGAKIEPVERIEGPFSIVHRVKVQTAHRTSHAYIKILKPRGLAESRLAKVIEEEYRATQVVYDAARDEQAMRAVRPIACLPEHRALVTEEVQGRSLRKLLVGRTRPVGGLEPIVAWVGSWIRLYQRIGGVFPLVELHRHREYVDTRLKGLEGRIISPSHRRDALREFDALVAEIGSPVVPAAGIHADLTPDNVIVGDDGRVTVLDFTMVNVGPACHDLTHFYFHLELMAARAPERRVEFDLLERALLNGYDPTLSAQDPMFRLMLLQHAVCHIALLAERKVSMLGPVYHWFVRRRWRACERMRLGAGERQVA